MRRTKTSDRPTPSEIMSRVHRRDTKTEVALRRSLWQLGVRGWRCDVAGLPGRPDLAFRRRRVAVFVDGALWHGHPRKYPGSLAPYWRKKIAGNIQRDAYAAASLEQLGWLVMRFWDFDIEKDAGGCAAEIANVLSRRPDLGPRRPGLVLAGGTRRDRPPGTGRGPTATLAGATLPPLIADSPTGSVGDRVNSETSG